MNRNYPQVDPLAELKCVWDSDGDFYHKEISTKRIQTFNFIMVFVVGVFALLLHVQPWFSLEMSKSQEITHILLGVADIGFGLTLGPKAFRDYCVLKQLKPKSIETFPWWDEFETNHYSQVDRIIKQTVDAALKEEKLDHDHENILRNLVVGYKRDKGKPDLSFSRRYLGPQILQAGDKYGFLDPCDKPIPREKWGLGS